MSSLIIQRQSLKFRARTYMAFVFTPRAPIADWLMELDATLERSKSFFAGHAVALDLSEVRLSPNGIAHLIANLAERNIRVLGIKASSRPSAAGLPPCFVAVAAHHEFREPSPPPNPTRSRGRATVPIKCRDPP